MKTGQEIVWVAVEKLVAHPRNANVMSSAVRGKLRRHLERTGRYEPLVVRRHPVRGDEGFFEMINGHHRKLVLEELGHAEVACLVWELDDREALMLLATVNRLSGEDAAGKRVELLSELAEQWDVEQAVGLLPESGEELRRVLESAEAVALAEAPDVGEMVEAFTVFLKSSEKERVVAALLATDRDLGRALVKWAERVNDE